MTLEGIIRDFDIKSYTITSKKELNLSIIKKAKYIDVYEYLYDDPDNPEEYVWIDIEGIGYGWIWTANKLRAHSIFLQRRAVKKYVSNLLKELDQDDNILIYKNQNGDECYGFMTDSGECYVRIRISEKELWYME